MLIMDTQITKYIQYIKNVQHKLPIISLGIGKKSTVAF